MVHRPTLLAVSVLVIAASCSRSVTADGCGRAPTDPAGQEAVAPVSAGTPEVIWRFESAEETFSSPRLTDLDGDGALDIVLGLGQDTLGEANSSLVAVNGADGELLWNSPGHEDLIGSATFVELDDDDVPDIVIGGRRGALVAVSGSTGATIWEFDQQNGRWFNFYTAQDVPDVDGDGTREIVAANGGLVIDEPDEGEGLIGLDEPRVVGRVFVISGADGSVIDSGPVPDGREVYMSALVIDGFDSGTSDVLFGTGGETLAGSLWRAPLDDLASLSADRALELFDGGDKGVIAVPSLLEFGEACSDHLVVQSFDGTVALLDAESGDRVWTVENAGFETYSSPTLGWFVGDDDIPDVFAAVAKGVWPMYEHSEYLLIDGATGQVVWRSALGTFAPSGFVAVDTNGDGVDEVIFGVNDVSKNTHQIHLLDTGTGDLLDLGPPLAQTTFSTPWVGDIDGDGRIDLVVTASAYHRSGSTVLMRLSLGFSAPTTVSWGAYMGTNGDGRLVTGS